MSIDIKTCVLCQKQLEDKDSIEIKSKGAEGINKASIERGDVITIVAGATVHKKYLMNYINKKNDCNR